MSLFDVICIGSGKIDAFLSIHHASSHVRLNKDTNELCVKSGEKIELDNISFLLGGNACNAAVGLSRLGLKSGLFAEIGKDEFAQTILSSLARENVATEFVQKTKDKATSLSIIINFQKERTIFSQHVQREHNFSFENISTKWIYLTSLGNKWTKAYEKTVGFAKKTGAKIAFNPGTLQLEKGYEYIKNILEKTEILFVNKEEAAKVISIKYKVLSIKELLTQLQKLGPKIVVITDGKNGSFAIDEKGNILEHEIVQAEVVEKTGAGDAYSSGFLAAFLHNQSIADAMKWGAKNSASVIGKVGAQPGLLTKNEIQ